MKSQKTTVRIEKVCVYVWYVCACVSVCVLNFRLSDLIIYVGWEDVTHRVCVSIPSPPSPGSIPDNKKKKEGKEGGKGKNGEKS